MGWADHIARVGDSRCLYRELVGKSEGRRPLGRPGRTWVYNINMDFQEVGLGVDWIDLAQHSDM